MMLGVIAIVEEQPVVNFSVAAYAPGNRFVRIGTIMAEITIQVTEAMSEVIKRQEIKHDVMPVQNRQHDQSDDERGQFDIAPDVVGIIAFLQFTADRRRVIPEITQENVAPWIFRLAIVTVSVNRKPIDGVAALVLPIGIALMMLHVN